MKRLAPLLVLLGACTGATSDALPPKPRETSVTAHDYRFDFTGPVAPGRVVFRLTNRGSVAHNITLLPLSDDLPPLDAQLHGEHREIATPFGGVTRVFPGQTRAFAVDLVPGQRYGMICTLLDPEGRSHALRGQNAEFRTTGVKQPVPEVSSTHAP